MIAAGVAGPAWTVRDLAVEVFYNQRLILAGLACGALLGLTGLFLARTQYVAESQILVRAAAEPAPREGLNGPAQPLAGDAVQRIVQSDIQIIGSDPVLTSALASLKTDAKAEDVERLRSRLQISAEPNSGLIKVTLKGPDRARALKSLSAILDAYARRRGKLYVSGPSPRQQALTAQSESELARLAAAIAEVKHKSGVLDIAQAIQLATAGLDALDQRRAQARERQLAAFGERLQALSELGGTPERILGSRDVTNAVPNDDAHNTLLRLRQDRAHVASQYAADWPGLIELDRKIAAAQAEIGANDQDTRHSDHMTRNPVFEQLSTRRTALDLELASLSRQIAQMDLERAAARDRIASLQSVDTDLHELERKRAVQEGIERQLAVNQAGARLADAALDDGNATLRIVQPPHAPVKGASLGPSYLMAGILFGAASALAGACGSSVLRQHYISAGEAERCLGLPALVETDASSADVGRAAGADAFAGLATLLADLGSSAPPVKLVQIVGVDRAGKSAFTLVLAKALARHKALGPVLIVDFDAEDRYRAIAPQAARRSFSMAGGRLSIARATTPGLWIATQTGETPLGDPTASVALLKEWIAILRQSFGLVLFAAPHAFADYPARRLYPLADANLLLIDATSTRKAAAHRMREVVLAAGGDLLGFVFTARRHFIPEPILKWL